MKMGTFIQRFIWYTQTLAHSSDMHVLDLSFGSPAGFAYPLAERAFRVSDNIISYVICILYV